MKITKHECPVCHHKLWEDWDGYRNAQHYLRCISSYCHITMVKWLTRIGVLFLLFLTDCDYNIQGIALQPCLKFCEENTGLHRIYHSPVLMEYQCFCHNGKYATFPIEILQRVIFKKEKE